LQLNNKVMNCNGLILMELIAILLKNSLQTHTPVLLHKHKL
jgi:hypothetical protein